MGLGRVENIRRLRDELEQWKLGSKMLKQENARLRAEVERLLEMNAGHPTMCCGQCAQQIKQAEAALAAEREQTDAQARARLIAERGWQAERERSERLREALQYIIQDGHETVTDEIDGMPIDRCRPGCAACTALAALAPVQPEKPYRCECGSTKPIHHHCGIKGWTPRKDEPCPACAARAHLLEPGPAPCRICGYNGPGYYQPESHPCAAQPEEQP